MKLPEWRNAGIIYARGRKLGFTVHKKPNL
jgi:hypothetical protein